MTEVEIRIVPRKQQTLEHQLSVTRLGKACFGNVSEREATEHFFSKGFARVFAYHKATIVGTLELFKRARVFDSIKYVLGGIGGVCVCKEMRMSGIGHKMMTYALETLKKENCDVACLNVDLEIPIHSFYEKLGFKLMNRAITFTDIQGNRVHDNGTMFIPINSHSMYSKIMNSNKTFHYGKGYW